MSSSHSNSAAQLEHRFFARLSGIIESQVSTVKQHGFAVAYSGGLDSTVLLKLACQFASHENIPLFAFHVHHGLSVNADDWLQHCERVCLKEAVLFRAKSVSVDKQGQGIESAARSVRYAAMGQLCKEVNVPLLLTAHHLDDQAETMLMQLLRGTGVRGLAGMDDFNYAPNLLENEHLLLARPLLHESKSQLQKYAQMHALTFVEDESNSSTVYTRNALRLLVMPEIEKIAPHFSERLLRTSEHVRSANRILDEVASLDLEKCRDGADLKIDALHELSIDRLHNVFRHWLLIHQVQLPSAAKLREMLFQMLEARDDARVSVTHLEYTLYRYDGKIVLIDTRYISNYVGTLYLQWNDEEVRYIPELKGHLLFQEDALGVDSSLLKKSNLEIRQRVGGERLRLAKLRPSRDMKSHFQTLRVPFWCREKLPYIYLENRLMHVGMVGTDAEFLSESFGTTKIKLTWVPDAPRARIQDSGVGN
jgi:tRNA(Ile)-lysidine synthase